ncbi:hypothetical protein B9Z55_000321 [Caenorhabditis nigoni]|uniref:SUN domain-containing protein n=1 Tax=Caenorhabditis nigoni TaxID=1611254 RepID=A0A2G5VP14_9PELO|nr:hypothetical protein B9Z55_000321 [Caenorhabditis nigoni]
MVLPTHRTNEKPNNGKNSPFNIEAPNSKTRIWYHWFNIRFRQYMILEVFLIITLIIVLYKLQTLSWQNNQVIEMVTDYLRGASVDNAHSSRSNLNPIIGYDQTNLVLLDRPQPPTHKAWCSNEHNPVLTINLAKYIKPISVSYQHSKWTHHIPMSTPRTYDVVACLDFYCENWKPLVSNCEYSSQSIGTEQFCNISYHLKVPSIGKVQFRFKENYGDSEMKCVHLVRVYGETDKFVKVQKAKNLESEKTCTDLKHYYHNSYYLKYTLASKSCSVLYKNDCCSDCPECCEECLISDLNGGRPAFILLCLLTGFLLMMILVIIMAHFE